MRQRLNLLVIRIKSIKLAKYRKPEFIKSLPPKARVLDVGCGNNGPLRAKTIRKDIYYVGIDIADYNNTDKDIEIADEYIKCDPERFAQSISDLGDGFDAVISSHNIEHCNHPQETISAMCKILKPKGVLYLAFPSERSESFPSRKGTLNFYDDKSHIWLPVWEEIKEIFRSNNMEIVFETKSYRPIILRIIGGVLEPISKLTKRAYVGTWALWGFESIIWARKK